MIMLYHVSFFPVRKFYPRVPKARCTGENSDIPRISFSNKSKLEALRAVPDAARIIQLMLEAGIKPTLYVYSIPEDAYVSVQDPSLSADGIRLLPCEQTALYVPDAKYTGECWLLDSLDMEDIFCETFQVTKIKHLDCWIDDIWMKHIIEPKENLEMIFQKYECRILPDNPKLSKFLYPGNENNFLLHVLEILKEKSSEVFIMKYYSVERPITPGSFPKKDLVQNIYNFDQKTFCEEIGAEAWGYVEYSEALSEKEASEYELIPEGLKTFWAVTTAFYDDGRVVSNITDKIQAAIKPEDIYKELKKKDLYIDWFETEAEAREHVQEALEG